MGRTRRFRWKSATGIFHHGDTLTATSVVVEALGKRRIEATTVPVSDGDVAAALRELNERGCLRGKVVCGVDPRRLFSFATPAPDGVRNRSASEFLPARLGSVRGGVLASLTPLKLPHGPHVLVVACPRPGAASLLEGLDVRRGRTTYLMPVPTALAALARSQRRRPRRWRTLVRLLPGPDVGLALLTHDDQAVAWRLFDVRDDAIASARTAVLSLRDHATEDLGLPIPEGLLVHAGEGFASVAPDLPMPTLGAPELLMDPRTASLALARLGLRRRHHLIAANLFNDLRPPLSLHTHFPYRAAAGLLGLTLLCGSTLYHETLSVEREAQRHEALAAAASTRVGVRPDALELRHEEIREEFETARAFIVRSVFWEDILTELPTLLPPTLKLTGFEGRSLVRFEQHDDTGPGNAISEQMRITGEVAVSHENSSPPEAFELTSALQASAVVASAFPKVTGAHIQLATNSQSRVARIVVVCIPGTP